MGMDRYEARKAVVEDLEALGLMEDRGLLPQRGHLLPLPQRRGAHHLRPVVREDEALAEAAIKVGGGREDPSCPTAAKTYTELDGERPRLVHFPAAVVGPPDPRLVLR